MPYSVEAHLASFILPQESFTKVLEGVNRTMSNKDDAAAAPWRYEPCAWYFCVASGCAEKSSK